MGLYHKMKESKNQITEEELNFIKDVNGDLFLPAYLENEWLTHTTPYFIMRNILKDGFLTGNKEHIQSTFRGKIIQHENMICFSSLPERHLSALPNIPIFISHDTFLRIPFTFLKEKYNVRPVIYEVDIFDLTNLNSWTHPFLMKREIAEVLYGDAFRAYTYSLDWSIENEWRVWKEDVILPDSTEVWCSNVQQRKRLSSLTNFPVYIHQEFNRMTRYRNKRFEIGEWFNKILRKEGYHAKSWDWNSLEGIFRLYDVIPLGTKLEDFCEMEYSKERKIREKTLKEVEGLLKSYYHEVEPELAGRDFIIDLLRPKNGKKVPWPWI